MEDPLSFQKPRVSDNDIKTKSEKEIIIPDASSSIDSGYNSDVFLSPDNLTSQEQNKDVYYKSLQKKTPIEKFGEVTPFITKTKSR